MKAFMKLFLAGVRQRKGTFFGIALLSLAVVAALVSSVSARENAIAEYRGACAETGAADMQAWVFDPAALLDADARAGFEDRLLSIEGVEGAVRESMLLASSVTVDGAKAGKQIAWTADDPDTVQYHVFNDAETGFTEAVPLEPGEAYLPVSYRSGVAETADLRIGSVVAIGVGDAKVEVTVKGFVEEPLRGMAFTSPNVAFLAPADFGKLRDAGEGALVSALADPAPGSTLSCACPHDDGGVMQIRPSSSS